MVTVGVAKDASGRSWRPVSMVVSTRPARNGYALAVTILALLVLSVLMIGMLQLAAQELQIARARVATLRARLAAESAARAILGAWPADSLGRLPVGGTFRPAGADASASGPAAGAQIERLGIGRYLVRATGAVPTSPGSSPTEYRLGVLVGMLDGEEFLRGLPAALTAAGAGTIEPGARIIGAPLLSADDVEAGAGGGADGDGGWGDPCIALEGPALFVTDSARWHVEGGAEITGVPSFLVEPAFRPGLAGTSPRELQEFGDVTPAGVVSPGPAVTVDGCDTSVPSNWGAPLDPGSPCRHHFPLIVAPGDLTVHGGAGQGILIVAGDLTLEAGAHFAGPIVVHGRLLVDSAFVSGGVLLPESTSSARVRHGSIHFDSCTLSNVVRHSTAFRRPFLPRGRAWIPLF